MKKLKISLALILIINGFISFSQEWPYNSLITGSSGNILGTSSAFPINLYTNNIQRAYFSTFSELTNPAATAANTGNGLRFLNPLPGQGSAGQIDIFCSSSNGTNMRFGDMGSLHGGNLRFEVAGRNRGLWLNAVDGGGRTIFNHGGAEYGRLGANNYWRIGANTSNVDATRRLEVVDNVTQFRLTYSAGTQTDFFTNSFGYLQIRPSGSRVGINLPTNPTANLDINGTVRIRDVPAASPPNSILVGVNASSGNSDVNVRRLNFTGNPNEALLGDGTWGVLSSGVANASNGCWINSTNEVEWGTNPLFHNTALQLAQNHVLFKTFPNESGVITFGGTTFGGNSRVIINNDIYTNGLVVNSISSTIIPIKYGVNVTANNANRLIAVSGIATTGNSVVGVDGIALEGLYYTTGLRGYATSSSTQSVNIGGDFSASGGNLNENIGARGFAKGSLKNNFGGKFKAGDGGSLSIGVYGECAPDNPVTGLTGYAAYFSGGVVTTGGTLWPSDSALKHNINPLDELSDSLMQLLTPVSYEYNQVGNASRLNLSTGTKFGFLAQQVEQYFPSAVREVTHPAEYDSLGNEIAPQFQYKAVDMSQLIPVMMSDLQRKTGLIQNQSAVIVSMDQVVDSLENQLADLNNRLSQLENCLSGILPYLCQLSQSAIQANTPQTQEAIRSELSVRLSNRDAIILDQNVPNPFAEQTVINFSIPETVQKAQIHFYDGQGKLIQSVDVVERGLGSLTVFGSDLSSGVYTYTLVADGQIVATKKMMKQ